MQHFHLEQKIIRNGKPIAACFANGLAKAGRDTVPTADILKALKIAEKDVPRIQHDFISLFDDANIGMTKKTIDEWEV